MKLGVSLFTPWGVALVGGLAIAALPGCHSAGPYGHSVHYAPLSDETSALAGTRDYDPVMVKRKPADFRKTALFGVVVQRNAGASGLSDLLISLRTLEARNLCGNHNDEETCRVTVSDTEFGAVHAVVRVKPEDDVGEHALGPGSLVHLVADYAGESDSSDGLPRLRGTYYRHFPRHFYRTRADAAVLRQ